MKREDDDRTMKLPDEREPNTLPRDKETLLRDFEVASRLKDIRDTDELRRKLSPKWWETAVAVVQFAAALGLLAALVQHPLVQRDPMLQMIVFWVALMILALVFGFEFLIFKLYHLRRANSILLRLLDEHDRRLAELEHKKGGPKPDRPESSETK